MKTNKFKLLIIAIISVSLGFTSCKKDVEDPGTEPVGKTMSELEIPDGFKFNTSENINIEIATKTNDDSYVPYVPVSIYTDFEENGGRLLFSGVTNQEGILQAMHPFPTYLDEVVVTTDYHGLPGSTIAQISNNKMSATLGGKNTMKSGGVPVPFKSTDATLVPMGTYNSIGVPDYLEDPGDIIDPGLLALVNTNLPEGVQLPDTHPEWILPEKNYDIELGEDCDVWITYIDEGAGWKNVLGFYTYEANNPPASKEDIETINIIFPNVSNAGEGGGLYAGDKVYLGQFDAGTNIGIVLLANGWNQANQTIGMGSHQVYSNPDFNPQAGGANDDVKQQFVMLYDDIRDLVLIGIEDILRPSGDQDFNDAIFYLTANPITAIDPEPYPDPEPIEDYDGDGVPDDVDDYPEDPDRAFDVYYPGEDQFGSLAYEDLWPSKGDYDFNDMVVDYNIHHVTNAANNVVDINGTYKLRAMGAHFENGFGFQFATAASDIDEIEFTYEDASTELVNFEGGQSKGVIILWENGFDLLPRQGNGTIGANTTLGVPPTIEDYTLLVTMTTSTPVPLADLGVPPYNPFVFINQERGKEAHLRDFEPTDLVNTSYFGTYDDASEPLNGIYYKTSNNLPWGIHLIESFDYPGEKIQIIDAYVHFVEWAESGGTVYPDWYQDIGGYRNASNIYP